MTDVLREIVLPRLEKVKKSGSGFMARCPAHKDSEPSLSVAEGREHPVIFKCQAGCDSDSVLSALGLDWADLSKPKEQRSDDGRFAATYDYRDERGEMLFQVCRTADKKFMQRRPDPLGRDGWSWGRGDTRPVLYRLPKVLQAVADLRAIYICEGEKDVHTLENQGLIATCNPGGAGKWDPSYSEALRGAVITIIADNDNPGRAHARLVRDQLTGIADSITIAEAAAGKDATDHFAAGHKLDDLLITWTTDAPAKPVLATDLWEFLDATDAPHDWVIPNLLEHGDRLILTGFEGLGKSMLVRQLAVAAAAGVDPFNTGYTHRYPQRKVLFIDCENSEAQSRRKLRPIVMVTKGVDAEIPVGGMRLIHRPEGIDLTTAADAAWLLERVTAHQPDLLIIGPFYRLHAANMNDEVVARRTVAVLDAARAVNGCALITEAHAGHGEAGKSRSVRPTGSSLLLRWPEFGYGLAPGAMATPDDRGNFTEVDVMPWRGPRDERNWPAHLQHGGAHALPWVRWTPPKTPPKGKP